MSLSAILDAIRSSSEGPIAEIEKDAYTQARLILAESHEDARELQEQSCTSVLTPAYHERARILHKGRLEAMRISGDAREALIDNALGQARGRLAGFRNHPEYARVLQQLVQQALVELRASLDQTGLIEVQADPRDKDLLQEILSGTTSNLTVTYDLTSWGGVIARSQDGGIVVINTLEARLERANLYLRRCLSAQFEAQP